jgi:outer membrane protein TolC
LSFMCLSPGRCLVAAEAAATANVGVATAALYPSLRLSGSIGVAALSSDALLRPEAATSSLLAGLTTPIFEGGRLRRTIEIQSALQEQALVAYEKSVANALAEVENALVALANARRRLGSLRSAAESAQLAEKLASYRYAAGLIDYSTLQDTQRTALSVLDAQASAQGDEASSLVQLYKSLGGGFGSDETASR